MESRNRRGNSKLAKSKNPALCTCIQHASNMLWHEFITNEKVLWEMNFSHVSVAFLTAQVDLSNWLSVLSSFFLWNVIYIYIYIYTGAGHIIRISSKIWFISLIPFKKWNLYNVYIHSTQTDIFQVFISFNFDDYKWQLMKTPNSVSQKIRILWKGSILKTPGATL